MFRIVNNIVDRCFFTFSFIIGVQLPEFIQQYLQRLSGHLNEAQLQLQQFQEIAQQHFQGSLATMIIRYKENSEPSIRNTADVIEQLTARINNYQHHVEQINQSNYLNKLVEFATNMNPSIAQATAKDYVLAIPIEVNALTTGAVLAILLLITKECSILCAQKVIFPKKRELI